MNDITTLINFLSSTLPAALITKAVVFIPAVNALVGILRLTPQIEMNKRVAAPAAAIVLGLFFGFVTVGFDLHQWLIALGAGALIGLSSIGGFSTVKNATQGKEVAQNG
jgi:hypothetical protein